MELVAVDKTDELKVMGYVSDKSFVPTELPARNSVTFFNR